MSTMELKINDVFEKISQKYGITDQLLQHKQDLLYVYANENKWRCEKLLKLIKPKHWFIDKEGNIHSVQNK